MHRFGSGQNTSQEPHQITGGGCQRCFIEVVEIEINKTIVSLVAAKVLQVKIATDPGRGRLEEWTAGTQSCVEQMACTTQENKGVLSHHAELQFHAFRIPSGVELLDLLQDVDLAISNVLAGRSLIPNP